MKVAVLGGGSFGCTIANVLADNKQEVFLWDHQESKVQLLETTKSNPYVEGATLNSEIIYTNELNIINEVELIVYVIPSFALREVSKKINSILNTKKNFLICTKGLEAETMKSGYQIVEEEVEYVQEIGILSGPTHAEELALQKYTTIVSTSKNLTFAQEIQNIFTNDYLRVYTNQDIIGVEILGAAKNVLAIAAGVCDSHPKLGDNAKAALLTRGLRELKLIGMAQKCNPETFYGLTGLGDLIVTATSIHSRNRRFGELLGTGLSAKEAQEKIGMVVEGIYSVSAIHSLKELHNLELPIIEAIHQVLYKDQGIEIVVANIFQRQVKSEH